MAQAVTTIYDSPDGMIRLRGSAYVDSSGNTVYSYILYGDGPFSGIDFSTKSADVLNSISSSGNNLILPNGTTVKIPNPPGAAAIVASVKNAVASQQASLNTSIQAEKSATPPPTPPPAKPEITPEPAPPPPVPPAPPPSPPPATAPAPVPAPPPEPAPKPAATSPKPVDVPPTENGEFATYKIKKGDTLSAIAKANGTTVDALLKANPSIKDPNKIFAGDTIRIPKKPKDPAKEPPDFTNIIEAESMATAQDAANFDAYDDWRVRLALSPGANYLYMADDPGPLLAPLTRTNGVIFPYTPTISVQYSATYENVTLVHSNYKVNQYTNSSVDQVTITGDFTAQDADEARYIMACIHFFRTMTKMFYGQDRNPRAGTPPPLCYIFGLGDYQFSAQPLAITGFTYNLPSDVDYIKTTIATVPGQPSPLNMSPQTMAATDAGSATSSVRLNGKIMPGGKKPGPTFNIPESTAPTYVPTKIQLSITCLPMMSRNQVSTQFSLADYAYGDLLIGTKRQGGGFW